MTPEQQKKFDEILIKNRINKYHSIFKDCMRDAYNAALEDAANSAEVIYDYLPSKDDTQASVNRKSITKLKIQ